MRVLICDDLKVICEAYKERMDYEEDIECVGMAHNSKQCIEEVKRLKPDLLLLDIQMETKDSGIHVLGRLKEMFPELKVIMLTGYDDDEYILSAFANGASDYFVKKLFVDELFETMRDVYRDKAKLHASIANKLARKTKDVMLRQRSLIYLFNNVSRLSESEVDMLRELNKGKTYNEIAAQKFVEPNSIRKKASRILKKCESESMSDLMSEMKRLGIFELFEEQ
jgi:DNA-binding NarL/FixJ family response regulator